MIGILTTGTEPVARRGIPRTRRGPPARQGSRIFAGWERGPICIIFRRVSQPNEKSNFAETSRTVSPPVPQPDCIAIIGLGLLGGSVAMAVRERMPSTTVIGCARREETRHYAVENHVVDEATADLPHAVAHADLVIVATPVDAIAQTVIEIARTHPHAIITDVGSTKSSIVAAVSGSTVSGSTAAARFAAAHPIAGSEKTGVENAIADLFVNRPVVITPSTHEAAGVVDRVSDFWARLGGNVCQMPPAEHDALLAISSHMPHLMASLIAGQLPSQARPIVGTGWLDTTRIAAGDPKMWTAIVAENRGHIVAALQSLGQELDRWIATIERQDDAAVETFLQNAQTIRLNAEPAPNSLIPKS